MKGMFVVQAPPLTSNGSIADSQELLWGWLHHLTEGIVAGEHLNREEAIALTQIQG